MESWIPLVGIVGGALAPFEDDDASRWKVTPANIDQISAEPRPDFG